MPGQRSDLIKLMKGQLDYIKHLFVATFQISVVLIDVFKLEDAHRLFVKILHFLSEKLQ